METKICTKCEKEYPAELKYWYAQKNGKYGLRSDCKECNKICRKQYTATDNYKKYHREYNAKWREENPEKALEISQKNFKINGHKHNNKRKEKYKNDPEYRKNKLKKDKEYTKTGRRNELNNSRERRELLRQRHRKTINDLRPCYVAGLIKMSTKEIDPELIETKRLILLLKRELRANNIKIK